MRYLIRKFVCRDVRDGSKRPAIFGWLGLSSFGSFQLERRNLCHPMSAAFSVLSALSERPDFNT